MGIDITIGSNDRGSYSKNYLVSDSSNLGTPSFPIRGGRGNARPAETGLPATAPDAENRTLYLDQFGRPHLPRSSSK